MGPNFRGFFRRHPGEHRPNLTVNRILDWADAHRAATGVWPTAGSGSVQASGGLESWKRLNEALHAGSRGLPGGQSLALVLADFRGVDPYLTEDGRQRRNQICRRLRLERRALNGQVTLSVERILTWADEHHARTGAWPSTRSGHIAGVPGETWSTINFALRRRRRGLTGGKSLTGLLAERRGARPAPERRTSPLTIDQILAWADAHFAAHGQWPKISGGAVAGVPDETWVSINQALGRGERGLPGGSSLPRLLLAHRGVRYGLALPPLRIDQILVWADAHYAATRKWPSRYSGVVREAPEEHWSAIDAALAGGDRGLPGGSSLPQLLQEHRPVRLKVLTLEIIRAWAEAHHQAHGVWPAATAGPVDGVPEEDWSSIHAALTQGRRGLPGGMSLSQLFGRSIDPALLGPRPRLSVDEILAWADAHHDATGRWPTRNAGPVRNQPGEKWVNIDEALKSGRRGLSGGSSLMKLLASRPKDPYRSHSRPPMTLDQILAWADAHHAAHGRWPAMLSGPIPGVPGEKWVNINQALRTGRRGLPSGLSLAKLFAGRPAPAPADAGNPKSEVRNPEPIDNSRSKAG